MQPTGDPIVLQLTGALPFILLIAVGLAAVASIVLLRAYRRAVVASMRRVSGPESSAGLSPTPPPMEIPSPGARTEGAGGVSQAATGDGVRRLYGSSVRALMRNAVIYGVAGIAYAAMMAAATLVSAGEPISGIRLLVLIWLFAWPLVFTLDRVLPAVRGVRVGILAGYAAVWIAAGAAALAVSPELTWGQLTTLWLVTNLPATLLLLGFLNHRVRAVGPLVLVFAFLAMAGANLLVSLMGSSDTLLRFVVAVGATLGLGTYPTFFGFILLGFVVGGVVAGRAGVGWIRRRYERKRMSDQTLTIDSIWLIFAVVQAIPLAFEGAVWALSGLGAFAVYKLVSGMGMDRLGRPVLPAGEAPRLLLLRVFALGRRSEALFDGLGTWWRHLGSIQMIAGPDLATTTVEPHEFLDFLSRKLDRRFITDDRVLDIRMSEMDLVADHDGRFRVADFFCHDDTWRLVLSRLVRESDAILMDLRGFSEKNAGCLYEIGQLIDMAPLEQVVFLIDRTTDEAFLRSSIRGFWNSMSPASPNRGSGLGGLEFFRSTGTVGRDLPRLVRRVLTAAVPVIDVDPAPERVPGRAG